MKKLCLTVAILLVFSLSVKADKNKEIYRCVSNDKKMIALSFDDGPHPTETSNILAILKKYDIKATFFTVGKNAELYPDILKQTAEEGHEIGNHTYSHIISKKDSSYNISEELKRNHEIILKICENEPRLFRPPGGEFNSKTLKSAKEMDYKIILWNVDTKDWMHRTTDEITKTVLSDVKSGSIILMHDYISGESSTAEALECIIPFLLQEGYSFVTVSQLIEYSETI